MSEHPPGTALRSAQVEIEVQIEAPGTRVFAALTNEIDAWWPRDFLVNPDAKAFTLDARLGGLMGEDWGDGGGIVWYRVVGLAAPRELRLEGQLFPEFGGPIISLVTLELQEDGRHTRLFVRDALLGPLSDEKLAQTRDGWRLLFGEALKRHIEEGPVSK